ncbi:hypothetical protein PIROE2DRAFT_8338 [Piromyces sp. E2]|nr:hypothetical protein PIROE2DRAFT_8338 [Piromyces sp. E2]|eukprot:OUM64796.1 hypothetical protein PIROE2DRAFT_8338 [Piromyces sp. E2]
MFIWSLNESIISSKYCTIRKIFGVCVQIDIIYDKLTVERHIKFYTYLKGVKIIVEDFDLLHEKSTNTEKLNGGQKRKLCIAMVFIGNPHYVFLDELTTGYSLFRYI